MEIGEIKKYILKNLSTGIVKTSFTLTLSVVAIPIIIKNIGLESYGIISVVLIFSSFTGVLDLGLSKALIFLNSNKRKNINEISSIYFLNLLVFVILFFLSIIIFSFNINLLGKKLSVNHDIQRLINGIAIMLLALETVNNLLRATLEANFKLQWVNWGFLLQSFIINIGWLILSLFNAKLYLFLYVPVISTIVTIFYHLILLPHIYKSIKIPDKKSFINIYKISFRFFKLGTLNSIHLPLIKYLIILLLGQGKAIGIFELATKLATVVNNLMSYISSPFFSLTAKHKDSNNDYILRLLKKVTIFLTIVSTIGYLVFITINKYVITYFFKEYSLEIFNVLNFILLGHLFIAISESVQKYLMGIGNLNIVTKIKAGGLIINLVLIIMFYLFNKQNLVNLALSYSISLILIGSYWLIFISRKQYWKIY